MLVEKQLQNCQSVPTSLDVLIVRCVTDLEVRMLTHEGIVFSFALVSSGYIAVSEEEMLFMGVHNMLPKTVT